MFDRHCVVSHVSPVGERAFPSTGIFLGAIQTPAPLLRTYIGNPIYTTPDAIDEIEEPCIAQLDVSDVLFKEFGEIPMSELYSRNKRVQLMLSARGMGKPANSCDASGMHIDSHNGRKALTVKEYLQRITIDKPRVVIALADEVSVTIGKKRLCKATERSAVWFHSLVTSATEAGVSFGDIKDDLSESRHSMSLTSKSVPSSNDDMDLTAGIASGSSSSTSNNNSCSSSTGSSSSSSNSSSSSSSSSSISNQAAPTSCCLFGVAQYDPHRPKQLKPILKHMIDKGACGIVIGNAHLGETAAERATSVSRIQQVLRQEYPDMLSHIPTMIQGADSLRHIIEAVGLGIDLVATNYPERMAKLGVAIGIPAELIGYKAGDDIQNDNDNNNSNNTTTTNTASKRDRQQEQEQGDGIQQVNKESTTATTTTTTSAKRQRIDTPIDGAAAGAGAAAAAGANTLSSATPSATTSTSPSTTNTTRGEMNMVLPVYQRDISPLVVGCRCHACRHHTRAYIHHLLLSKEMLAEVLLYHHNMHQIQHLLQAARTAIQSGTYTQWEQKVLQLC